jgi:molybdate transport system regulatory protein
MKKLGIESSIWIERKKHPFISKRRIELLKCINKTGSLLKAAKSAKMSYKSAWDSLKNINDTAGTLLVKSVTGGKNGGGSVLTNTGHLYVRMYDKIYEEQKHFFETIERYMDNYDEFMRILERKTLRTSARNQLYGKVAAIKHEGLMSIIEIDVNGILMKASITSQSAEEMSLKADSPVWLIIKASWIEFVQNDGENVFDATIKDVKIQDNSAEYTLLLKNETTSIVGMFKSLPQTFEAGENVKIFIDKSKIIIGI